MHFNKDKALAAHKSDKRRTNADSGKSPRVTLSKDNDFSNSTVNKIVTKHDDKHSSFGRETPCKKSWKSQMPDLSRENSIVSEKEYVHFSDEEKGDIEHENEPPSTSSVKKMWLKCGKCKKPKKKKTTSILIRMANKNLAQSSNSRRADSLMEEMYKKDKVTFYQRNKDLIIYGVLHVIFVTTLALILFYLHNKGTIDIFREKKDTKVRDLSKRQ